VGGSIASLVIVGLCAVTMASWSAGLPGDLLLGAAAIGLLWRLPHTIPVWSGLTLLLAIAVALSVGNQDLASRFADLAYYGIAVGCLWGIWNMLFDRLGWQFPLQVLDQRWREDGRQGVAYGAVTALIIVVAYLGLVRSWSAGIAPDLLVLAGVAGLLWRLPWRVAAWCGLTLALAALLAEVVGNQPAAARLTDLAAYGLVVALFWLIWGILMDQLGWRLLPSIELFGHGAGKETRAP